MPTKTSDRSPAKGDRYTDNDMDNQPVEVLHVSETHVIVQHESGVSRYTSTEFTSRFRRGGKKRS